MYGGTWVSAPKFSIIIPTYSNSTGVFECLDSIVKQTDLSDVEILVVANGAPEATSRIAEVYREYPIELIWIPEACGYTHACNVGIEAARGSHIVLLNDDVVILGSHWLQLLCEPFESDPRMAITGPLMLTAPETRRQFLVFFCVMISRAVIDDIGPLDEIFNPGYAEDCDFGHRAEDAGWKIQQVPTSPASLIDKGCEDLPQEKRDKMWHNPFPCYHNGNQTFGKEPKFEGLIKRNSAILAERHGKKVISVERAKSVEGWFAEDEIEWLASQVKALPENAVVVEIGSWKGRSSRAIADNLPKGGKLYCVDSFCGSSGEPDAHLTAKDREGDNVYMSFFHALHDHLDTGNVIAVRMTSLNAAETLNNLRPQLIFIDGAHDYESVKTDIEAWLPLLADNGTICGHDYYAEGEGLHWVGVRQAVEERFLNVEKAATSIWHVRPHEQQRGRVFDCFLLSGELDVLEIRLNTLDKAVDCFVIAEGTLTHAGQPKPLHFELNKERFAKWLPKIRHVIVDDWPEVTGNTYEDAWARERHQRDAVMHALHDCRADDIVIIGDADEIASPEAVANYRASDGLVRLRQRMFYYYLNCENKEGWDWQKISPYSLVRERTPCGIRYPPAGEVPLVENGGWHFSFLAPSTDGVIDKLKSYSHQEMNRPEIVDEDHVKKCRQEGLDLFGRDLKYEFIDIDDGYPEYVKEHRVELAARGLIKELAPTVASDLSSRHWTVTASVSTKDRYTTTLPLTIAAIFNQTRLPDRFVLYDDSDERIPAEQLCQQQPFEGLFKLATDKGIKWEILSTPRMGQVANHQHCLDTTDSQFIWRTDDDEIPEPDCLEQLLNTIRDYERGGSFEKVGAVGGLVHHPGAVSELPQGIDGSLDDIAVGVNLSWFNWNGGARTVDHLYSTFLLQVDAARKAGGYPRSLSKVGHREETILTHSIRRAGYELLCTPHAKTYHLRASTGGIRSYSDTSLWEHDEQVFSEYLKTWGVVQPETKLIVADYGLGDHLVLKGIWPELVRKFPERKWTLALCYPEVFAQEDVTVISIADAKLLVGDRYDSHSLYRWCWSNDWKGSIVEAMKEFYSR